MSPRESERRKIHIPILFYLPRYSCRSVRRDRLEPGCARSVQDTSGPRLERLGTGRYRPPAASQSASDLSHRPVTCESKKRHRIRSLSHNLKELSSLSRYDDAFAHVRVPPGHSGVQPILPLLHLTPVCSSRVDRERSVTPRTPS
jgi:hypothetical protein